MYYLPHHCVVVPTIVTTPGQDNKREKKLGGALLKGSSPGISAREGGARDLSPFKPARGGRGAKPEDRFRRSAVCVGGRMREKGARAKEEGASERGTQKNGRQ